jgi:carboxymethylenebutenolidase
MLAVVALLVVAAALLRRVPPERRDESMSGVLQFESGGKTIAIDRVSPVGEGKHPAVFLLHGSGGLDSGLHDRARELAGQGYVAMVLHYFDLPGVAQSDAVTSDRYFVAWMKLVADALEFAGKQPDVDGQRIGLMGYSLGGYLALEVAATNPRVAAVVDYFGGMSTLITDHLERMPPTLLLHGEQDFTVPVREARRLEKLFREKGFIFEIKTYPNQGHGFSGAAAVDAWERTLGFLDRYLKRK